MIRVGIFLKFLVFQWKSYKKDKQNKDVIYLLLVFGKVAFIQRRFPLQTGN